MRIRMPLVLALIASASLSTATTAFAYPTSRRHPSGRARLQRAATVQDAEKNPASGVSGAAATNTNTNTAAPPPSRDIPSDPALPATFEELLRKASPLDDLQTLLMPPTGGCEDASTSIERARCESSRAFLRRTLPARWFWTYGDDPQVLKVSDYDPEVKGYRVSLAGCLACAKPLPVGDAASTATAEAPASTTAANADRFITLMLPGTGAGAESLREAVELNRSTVAFEDEAEAQSWWAQAEGNLQVQFVLQATATEWSHATGRGYALKLLGFRLFNRCTREVVVSRPPSTASADVALTESCLQQDRSPRAKRAAPEEQTKTALSAQDLTGAMAAIRPQVTACFAKFSVPGRAQLEYVVAGNGTVQSVRLSGLFTGTPTGACVLEAARGARFPRFASPRQQFDYPFFLRAD